MQLVDLFEFLDYRAYLRAKFMELKKTKRAFSYRFFAKRSGLSIGLLTLVIEGERNLTLESIKKFCTGLQLGKSESDYFSLLVLFNQAKTQEEKSNYFLRLTKFKRLRKLKGLETSQFDYLSHWHNVVIREMVPLAEFREDPSWISSKLTPQIGKKEAKKAMQLLRVLRLIAKGPDGKWIQTDANLSSGSEIVSIAMVNFHQQMIDLAKKSVTTVHGSQRDVSSVTLSIDVGKLPELKAMIRDFRRKLIGFAETDKDKHDHIYQFNVQFFPVSGKIKGES